jgi:hypothetical protein
LFEPLWTPDIVEELRRNLISGAKLTPERADEIIREMSEGSLLALIDGYQALILRMTNHPKDRHVLAAAVFAKADLILTFNLRDFRRVQLAPYQALAQSPDDLLTEFAFTSFAEMQIALERPVRRLPPPLQSMEDVLDRLEKTVPIFADSMRVRMLADQL